MSSGGPKRTEGCHFLCSRGVPAAPRGERPGPSGRPTQREPFARRSREKIVFGPQREHGQKWSGLAFGVAGRSNFFPRATSEGFSLSRSSAGAWTSAPGKSVTHPVRIRPMENGTPLSVLALFIIKCLFYTTFSPFLPRRRAKAAATTTQKWSFHNLF